MNKIVSLAFLLLVATMIFSAIPIHAYSEPGLDSLVRIASDARDHIKLELAKINNVSEELLMLYEQGSSETDSLIDATEQGDVPTSREHFMSAMNNFKKIGESIGKQKPTAELVLNESTDPSIGLDHVISRMESYLIKLQTAAEKYDSEINFDELNQLISQAKINIKQGNSAEAIKIIDILKPQILDIYDSLKIEADQQKADRAKEFADRHVQRLDSMITQAKSLGLKNETIAELEQSRINLLSASDSDQIVKQVRIIISVKNQFDEVKVNRTEAQINQLESKLNELSSKNELINSAKFGQAKIMLNELKGLISEGNFNDAIITFKSLKNLIKEIEKPGLDKDRISDTDDHKEPQVDSVPELKTDRISAKINKLETETLRLLDQVEEGSAAERWLERSMILLENAKTYVDEDTKKALKIMQDVQNIIKRAKDLMQ